MVRQPSGISFSESSCQSGSSLRKRTSAAFAFAQSCRSCSSQCPPATQDANAAITVSGKLVENANFFVAAKECGAKIQNLKVACRILASKIIRRRRKRSPRSRPAPLFPLLERQNDGEGKAFSRREIVRSKSFRYLFFEGIECEFLRGITLLIAPGRAALTPPFLLFNEYERFLS